MSLPVTGITKDAENDIPVCQCILSSFQHVVGDVVQFFRSYVINALTDVILSFSMACGLLANTSFQVTP